MHRQNIFYYLLFWCCILPLVGEAKTEGALDEGMVNPGYDEQPGWFKNSFLDINEDIDEAAENGKRLLLFFYQDGRPYCKKLLEDNFGQRDIVEKTRNNFDVVAINIWGDRQVTLNDRVMREKDFAAGLKVMYTPTLIFFNEQGKAVLRANGYYHPAQFMTALDYVIEKHDSQMSFREYEAKVSPPRSTGKLHTEIETASAPYDFSKSPTRGSYRLVMFEQLHCNVCDELHNDIMKRSEMREQLSRFDVSVLDMWSDDRITRPDGQKSTIRDWAKSLNIQYAPSLVFFNSNGEEVFRIEAYLKAFHIESVMDYVSSGAYLEQPNFQRYIDARADRLEAQGRHINIMK